MSFVRLPRLLLLATTATLAGCATLPASGPTAGEIQKGAKPENNTLGFQIVPLDRAVVDRLQGEDAAYRAQDATLVSLQQPGRNDVVGPGDILAISVYEVGVGLFASKPSAEPNGFDPSARAENFPAVTVDRTGGIELPYVGRLVVGGHSLPEIQTMIAHAYRGQSQSPQVVVALKQNVAETVFVSGEVRRPGLIDLSLKGERLLDAIATAGGINTAPEDTVIRFTRGARTIEERFDLIRSAAGDDLLLIPGDRIEIIKRPRTFLVLGATAKVSQIPFENSDVSLAEALARAGGPSDYAANPRGVYIFRYQRAPDGSRASTPVAYLADMLDPRSYFLTQRFAMQDKDIIYISNAASNRPAKLVTIINQLLGPFISARAVAR